MGQFVDEIYYRILYNRTHSITETYSTTEYACVRLRFSARSVLSIVQKRPIYSTKETYLQDKRDLSKRDLSIVQKRPIYSRALIICVRILQASVSTRRQKRPI